jgi:hypothetical protein
MALSLFVVTVAMGAALQLTSAGGDRPRISPAGRDSVRELKRARSAQDEFERTRRAHAPRTWDRSPRPCNDQLIGRFCFWYGDTAESKPPEEPSRIVSARRKLLGALASSARVIAGDDWVAGQRMRYVLEAGDTAAAVALSRECKATGWWCDALRGFALHAARDYERADAAFSDALARMPERERCRWTDLSALLDDDTRERYRKLRCEDRAAENARLWWLGDPFHTVPGNDRRTEHYSRLTMARMHEQAWNAHGIAWGDDLRELVVRYGWSTWWTRGEAPLHAPSSAPITGRSRTPAYHFLPEGRIAADPRASSERDWPVEGLLRNGKTAQEYYSPSYAISVSAMDGDAQLFRRGDSALAVVTWDATADTRLAGLELDAAVALTRNEREPALVRHERGAKPTGVMVATTPWRSMLMSLELLSPLGERGARARRWVGPTDTLAPSGLSGLLLLDPDAPLPATLDEALPHVRTGSTVPEGGKVGLFWEAYDVGRDDTLAVTITVDRESPGTFRRMAEALRLKRQWTPMSLAWHDPAAESRSVAGQSVVLDLSELARGGYRVRVRVTRLGGETLVAERRIEVVGRRR